MSFDAIEQQIVFTGGLLSISIFQERLMKNFMIINNRLRKLQSLNEIQIKTKNNQKELKFLGIKVDTIIQKLPKDGASLNRNDVKIIAREQIQDLFNSNDESVTNSKFYLELKQQIGKLKEQIANGTLATNTKKRAKSDKKDGEKRNSFTAGQVSKEGDKINIKLTKEALQNCLDEEEMEIVNSIIDDGNKDQVNQKQEISQLLQIKEKIQDLYHKIDQLRLGKGYNIYAEDQVAKYEKFEQYEDKSRQTTRKQREKPMQLQGIRPQNIKGQILKSGLYTEIQKIDLAKQEIARHELMQKKSFYSNNTLLSKKVIKQEDWKHQISGNDKFKRSKSIAKIDRMEKRLRVDDTKDLNPVFRQIELRIEGRVSHQIFMGFIKDFQQKLQILKLTKDQATDILELKKSIYVIDNKMQSIINYLQSVNSEDEALLVKKQWTCVSCDKNLQKYAGKVGQHLNWDMLHSKKFSPTRVGAFGQTGQLAYKIRNIMDNQDAE